MLSSKATSMGLKTFGNSPQPRDSKSGERGEHARAIFLPLLC